MASRNLEEQIARLSAIEDIKQLKARYCAYCDAQYDPEGLASLFVEDGVWDGGETFGRYAGRDAIRNFFQSVSGELVFAAHLVLNPIITVNGNTATGQWRLIMPCTVKNEAGKLEARWLLSAYDEEYVERDGRWLFKELRVTPQFYAAHETGWAEQTGGK
ncbi:MAG: nuclear transport factor 2 family protein [Candidatus Binatia bacterium]